MSGFEVLERLTELAPRLGRVPFVFLTALADRNSELRGRRLGADDYVTKPIDFDILATIIKARLAGVARTKLSPKLPKLNEREIEALTWVARGKTSTQIAGKLGLVNRTVAFHIDNDRIKLAAATSNEAVITQQPAVASVTARGSGHDRPHAMPTTSADAGRKCGYRMLVDDAGLLKPQWTCE
jgi:DNA-binding NarL/FixJ family response regulator